MASFAAQFVRFNPADFRQVPVANAPAAAGAASNIVKVPTRDANVPLPILPRPVLPPVTPAPRPSPIRPSPAPAPLPLPRPPSVVVPQQSRDLWSGFEQVMGRCGTTSTMGPVANVSLTTETENFNILTEDGLTIILEESYVPRPLPPPPPQPRIYYAAAAASDSQTENMQQVNYVENSEF